MIINNLSTKQNISPKTSITKIKFPETLPYLCNTLIFNGKFFVSLENNRAWGEIKKKAVQTGMTHYRHHKKGNNSSGVTVNVHSIGKRDLLATALETPTLRIGEGNRPFLGFRSPLLFADEHFFSCRLDVFPWSFFLCVKTAKVC